MKKKIMKTLIGISKKLNDCRTLGMLSEKKKKYNYYISRNKNIRERKKHKIKIIQKKKSSQIF